MAKFLNFFPIGSMGGDSAYLGLSPDSVEGRVISTLDQNIVFLIQLSDQKQIHSWTSEEKLSHKVVYDFKSAQYVGVFENQKLGCWGKDTKKIGKGKIKLPKSLEEIISFDDKHTILVYKDGTCESLENRVVDRKENCKPIVQTQTHQISRIACFNAMDNRLMLTYFVRNLKTPGKLELVYFLLNDDDLTPRKSAGNIARVKRIEIAKDETTLSAFTVVEGYPYPSVITIGSDKRIYMLPLNCDENAPSEFGAHSATFNCLRVDRPLTVISVSTNCIAIYGGNTKQDGASLVLYNTVHFTTESVQHFKVHLGNCRLWAICKHILMADGQRLLCARFRISQGKLSEAIGSKRSVEWDRPVNKECINEEGYLEEVTTFDKAAKKIDARANSMQNAQQSHNEYKTPEIFENFKDHLTTLYSFDIATDFVHGEPAHDMKIRSVVHPKDGLYSLELVQILSDLLESRGASETEIADRLIPILIKAKQPQELAVCLRKYTNVSEKMLTKCLKYFLSMNDPDEKIAYVNQMFACSFDHESIKEHLRTDLNLDDAIYLLDLIHRNLGDDGMSLVEGPQYGHDFDSDIALINWFVVILEAHYQQFLLSRDSTLTESILKWKELIEEFVQDIQDVKHISAKLANLVSGKFKENDNTSSKWYSVERVKLY